LFPKETHHVNRLLRFENGKIAENWLQFDLLGLMQQLGVIPAPAQAA